MELNQAGNKKVETGTNPQEDSTRSVLVTALNDASLLARQGKLMEAENLFLSLSESDLSRIEILDLLAKIYAQQGRIKQAQSLWLKALEREPLNIHFISALQTCAYQQKPKFQQFTLRYLWTITLIIIWFIIVFFVVVSFVE